MNHKLFERINLILAIMLSFGIFAMCLFAYHRINNPGEWTFYGFLAVMSFLALWTGLIGCFFYEDCKNRKAYLTRKELFLANGISLPGKIVSINTKPSYTTDDDGNPSGVYLNFASIEATNSLGDTEYFTTEIRFNPKKLLSDTVTVHLYENEFYVDGFQLGSTLMHNKCELKEIPCNIDNSKLISTLDWLPQLITGPIFIFACFIFLINVPLLTKIVSVPFIIIGTGLMIQWSSPILILFAKKKRVKDILINIGYRIATISFSIFWFGFLIIADYICFKQGNTSMLWFSLIFWVAGIWVTYKNHA